MLTQFQSDDRDFQLMQNSWAAQINPLLDNPMNKGLLLNSINLVSGDNTINHKLSRKLQGWYVVGQNASATFFDKQSTNQMPDRTLILNSSGTVQINLVVF